MEITLGIFEVAAAPQRRKQGSRRRREVMEEECRPLTTEELFGMCMYLCSHTFSLK